MIEVNNLTNFSVDKSFFLAVAKNVLKGENKELENLSIAFVSPQEIRKVNKKYRRKDKPTDVLSFERTSNLKEDFSEVIICPQIVKKSTKNSKVALKKELAKVLVHGILHTLRYDHEVLKEAKLMETKETYYFSKIFKVPKL